MKFLGRAKKLFREMAEPSKPRAQRFSVRCPSGHWIRGERTLGYQALRCPGCGEGIFVLPISPLPEPATPEGTRAAQQSPAMELPFEEGPVDLTDVPSAVEYSEGPTSQEAGAEIIWDDAVQEPVEETRARPRTDRPKPIAADESQGQISRPRTGPKNRAVNAPTARLSGISRQEIGSRSDSGTSIPQELPRPRRFPQRPALIFIGVALLVIGTLSVRYWRSLKKELPGIYEQGRTEGIAALDAGQFDKAHQLLSAARRAVDTLGGELEGAEQVRQAADEAAIFINLAPETLEDMLNEAGPMDPQEWQGRFKTLYAGHTILIDANIAATPISETSSSYELDYLILPPGAPSQFRQLGTLKPPRMGKISLSDFQLIQLARPRIGERVLFGAKLASFAFDPKADQWIVRLVPDSGVFITHANALESLGWSSDSLPAVKSTEVEP